MHPLAPCIMLALALPLTAGGPAALRVRVGAVPLGGALRVPAHLRAPAGGPVDAVIVTRAADGWHALLAWSTQAGPGCADKGDRTPTFQDGALRHPGSGTVWNLDARDVAGPRGSSLVALPVRVRGSQVVVQEP
jgi:hypothetical protein